MDKCRKTVSLTSYEQYKDSLIKECDKYLTYIAKYEFKGQKEFHHLINRNHLIYRYDFNNLYPLDRETHGRVEHEAGYETIFLKTLPLDKVMWIEEHNKDDLRDILFKQSIEKGEVITEVDFLEEKRLELLKRLPNKYELYLFNRQLNGLATFSTKLIEQRELDRLNSFRIEREIKLRELKPKRKKLTLAKKYNHDMYLKAKECIRAYKNKIQLETN